MNEAELLFTQLLDCDRASLYLHKKPLSKKVSCLVSSALKRRITGEPIQYILGKTEFMGLEFKVTPDVLIPRPETEVLVEAVIEVIRRSALAAGQNIKILEMGTGSGCISISLARAFRNAEITAVDISSKALEIARENSLLNNVNIDFLQSDLFSSGRLKRNAYDLIISNPPYIPTKKIKELQPEIAFEPLSALDGGEDGLGFYRKMAARAKDYLKEGGFLVVEIGFGQREKVEKIFKEAGYFKTQEAVKDYNGIDRVIVLQNS